METDMQDNTSIEKGAPGRLIRLPEVISRVGLKRSSIYQRMSEGRFPKSRSLGPKCAVWVEAEIEAWVSDVVDGLSPGLRQISE
jgi:prophage regulatory protein